MNTAFSIIAAKQIKPTEDDPQHRWVFKVETPVDPFGGGRTYSRVTSTFDVEIPDSILCKIFTEYVKPEALEFNEIK